MKKVTYIIPIHELTDETKKYCEKAFKSLAELEGAEKTDIFLVGELAIITEAQELFSSVCGDNNEQLVTLVPTDEKDLFKKINLAVSKCKTPYFSLLEFDDEYYPYWDKVAQRYTDENYSIILPITEVVATKKDEKKPDTQENEPIVVGFANELVWDVAFIDKGTIGYIEHHDLLVFKDFITSGGYISVKDFKELGGLKPELKIAAWYEYLLHTVTSGKKIYVVPRIGYKHTILREGSYLVTISDTLTTEEGAALIKQVIDTYPLEENNDLTDKEE